MKTMGISLAILSTIGFIGIGYAQQPLPADLQSYFNEKFGANTPLSLSVRYQSDTTVVLFGETVVQYGEQEGEPNTLIWQGADILKKEFGYSIVHVEIETGLRVYYYIVMTRG